jgi:L-threonylcarbamoyladenylate synthase
VYGIASLPEAVSKLYEAKGRPASLDIPVLVGGVGQLDDLGVELDGAGRALADAFWPGALTLVTGFRPQGRPPAWLEGRDEVAVRYPKSPLVEGITALVGPLLVTSANRHGQPTPAEAGWAAQSLAAPPDLVVDGGPLDGGTPSTLVNLRTSPASIQRLGAVPAEVVQAVIRAVPAAGTRQA